MINESDIGKRVRFLGGDVLDDAGKASPILGRVLDADHLNVKVEWDDGVVSTYPRPRVESSLSIVEVSK